MPREPRSGLSAWITATSDNTATTFDADRIDYFYRVLTQPRFVISPDSSHAHAIFNLEEAATAMPQEREYNVDRAINDALYTGDSIRLHEVIKKLNDDGLSGPKIEAKLRASSRAELFVDEWVKVHRVPMSIHVPPHFVLTVHTLTGTANIFKHVVMRDNKDDYVMLRGPFHEKEYYVKAHPRVQAHFATAYKEFVFKMLKRRRKLNSLYHDNWPDTVAISSIVHDINRLMMDKMPSKKRCGYIQRLSERYGLHGSDVVSYGHDYYHRDWCFHVEDSNIDIPLFEQEHYYQDEDDGYWWSSRRDYQRWKRENSETVVYDHDADVTSICDGFKVADKEQKHIEGLRRTDLAAQERREHARFPFLGFELEVEVREEGSMDTADEVNGLINDIGIIKTDGSVGGGDPEQGFEIVSIPASLKWHQSGVWDKFFDYAPPKLRGWHSSDCGMHVHVSRSSFATKLHLAKFSAFFNLKCNEDFIVRLAGRSSNDYSRIIDKKISESHYNTDHGRYQAVNLTNSKTVEVRIFQSNVAKLGFFKNLEAVHAAWDYTRQCRPVTLGKDSMNWQQFVEWVGKSPQRKAYPALVRWLEREQLLERRVIKVNFAKETLAQQEGTSLCA